LALQTAGRCGNGDEEGFGGLIAGRHAPLAPPVDVWPDNRHPLSMPSSLGEKLPTTWLGTVPYRVPEGDAGLNPFEQP